MGGYAFYVWGSFGACVVCLGVEPLLIRQKHRQVLQRLREQRNINAATGW